MEGEENVCPQAWGGRAAAIARELRRVAERPPPGVKLLLRDDDLTDVKAIIEGPADTPYAGGSFVVALALGSAYPAAAPRARFVTRIFHPNVSAAGDVCVSTLARDWRPALGLAHALQAVRCLLIAPNADSALNAEAAALLRDRYDAYAARARLYTDIHARPSSAAQETEVPAGEGSAAASASAGTTAAAAPRGKRSRRAGAGTGAGAGAAGAGGEAARARDRRRILKRL